nr:uncharacterized protein LOC109184816 [Ipomoea trifida]
MTTFFDMDSDEWGIMTLREKVVELGFNKDDNLRFFTLGEKGLFEFMTDLETWNLVNNVVRPKVVEIWAILGVEYGGVQVPTNVEAEMHVDPQAADALNLSDDGAEFQTTARPIPQLPSPLWLGRTFSKKSGVQRCSEGICNPVWQGVEIQEE